MKRNFSLLFLIIIYVCPLKAQNTEHDFENIVDSTFFYQQATRNFHFIMNSPSALAAVNFDRIGYASLLANYTTGHWRKAQEAEYDGNAGFITKGVRSLGRFKLAGSFSYVKTWQDSLAWITKRVDDEHSPYYFAAGKAGQFQRQRYDLGAILSYELLKNRLYLSSGVDYSYQTNTRSIDPRPSINTFIANLTPGISFKQNRHTYGIFWKVGFGNEYVRSTFKNDDFFRQGITDPKSPERLNNLIEGYGLYNPQHGAAAASSMDRDFNNSGIIGNYIFRGENFEMKNNISYAVDYQHTYFTPTSNVISSLGEYQLATFSYNGILDFKSKKANRQLVVDVYSSYGDDFNHRIGWSNYEYHRKYYGLTYLQLQKKYHKITPEYGLTANYNETEKKDYASEHHSKYSYLDITLNTALYFNNRNENKLAIFFNPSIRKILTNKLDEIPENQTSNFTREVVFPDYHYHNLNAISLNLGINYIDKNLLPLFPLNIKLNSTLSKPLDVNMSSSYRNSSRIFTQLTIGILL